MSNITNPVTPEARLALRKLKERAETIAILQQFYGASSVYELVEAQAVHISKLQARLATLQSAEPAVANVRGV